MGGQPEIPIVYGDPAPVQIRLAATPVDAAGRSYPVIQFQTGAITQEIRLGIQNAKEIAEQFGPALAKAAAEAERKSGSILTPPSGLIIPNVNPRNGGSGG
jgi:hypothetical protein